MLGDDIVSNQRTLVEWGLQGRVPKAVRHHNTVEELSHYFSKCPNKGYRLVSVMFIEGDFILIWEKDYANKNH